MLKKCTRCKIEKTLDNFHKGSSKIDGKHPWCKQCAIENSKFRYRTAEQKDYLIKYSKNKVTELQQKANKVKEKYGCCKCKEDHPVCLDFHHINPEEKIKDVSMCIAHKSVDKAIIEMNKCIVVCANCHRKIERGYLQLTGLEPRVNETRESFDNTPL